MGFNSVFKGLRATPEAALSKAWICRRSLAGTAGSNPEGDMDMSLVFFFQAEIPALGWSLVQRSPTECGALNCVWSWSLDNEEDLARWGPFVSSEKYIVNKK